MSRSLGAGPGRALLDANVLYPAYLRDVLLQMTHIGLYEVRWSQLIEDELMDALARQNPDRSKDSLEYTRSRMNLAFPAAKVAGRKIDYLTAKLVLPDPDDRHVLAAAIAGNCEVIVTNNLRDFPRSNLRVHAIKALTPDQFLLQLLQYDPELFLHGIKGLLQRLNNPAYAPAEYLSLLARQGLVATSAELSTYLKRL